MFKCFCDICKKEITGDELGSLAWTEKEHIVIKKDINPNIRKVEKHLCKECLDIVKKGLKL